MLVKFKKFFIDYLLIFIGSALFSLGFNLFIRYAQIAIGGITGIGMVINYFFPQIPMGFLTLILNIPFLLIGLWQIGGEFMTKTIFSAISMSFVMTITDKLPALTSDPLLCSLYGGIFIGAGIGLVLLRNGSTGGSDIVGCILRKRYSGVSLGRLVLMTDTVIVLCASFAFRNINSILYAIIKMYVASIATDAVLYGFNYNKVAYIFTENTDNICERIITVLAHGASIINCVGAYTNEPRKMIMCAINPNQIGKLKQIVREADERAFIIVTNTHEVLGFGFKPNIKSNL